jgi:hypothetical protein
LFTPRTNIAAQRAYRARVYEALGAFAWVLFEVGQGDFKRIPARQGSIRVRVRVPGPKPMRLDPDEVVI